MRKFLFTLFLFLASCNYTVRNSIAINERCVYVVDYNKYLCLDSNLDSNLTYFYIDKNRFEKKNSKFSGLSSFDMVVVDENPTILSNDIYSIKVKWFNDSIPCIGDTVVIICKEDILSESVLVKS